MMNEKPQKRLVNQSQYIRITGKKWTLYSTSAVLTALALAMVFGTALGIFRHVTGTEPVHPDFVVSHRNYFLEGGADCVLLFLLTKLSLYTRKRGKAIAPVSLLTGRNGHLLPMQETLVRASSQPPIQQQAELLRAAQYGQETPAEQLLRAGPRSRKDV